MSKRVFAALLMLTTPLVADSGGFYQIRNKDSITLVLPNGECHAKVVSRILDQLTLKLESKASVCGEPKSLMVLSRLDIMDVVNNRRRDREWLAPVCGVAALIFVGAPAGAAVAEETGSRVATSLVVAGSILGGAFLCGKHGSHYTVLAERVVPAQP